MSKPDSVEHHPHSTAGYWSANQPGLKWLDEAGRSAVTTEAYVAIRSDRYRRAVCTRAACGNGRVPVAGQCHSEEW